MLQTQCDARKLIETQLRFEAICRFTHHPPKVSLATFTTGTRRGEWQPLSVQRFGHADSASLEYNDFASV